MYRVLASFVFLTLAAFGTPHLYAQTAGLGTELSMSMLPEHPRPGEKVVVSVESYNIDLNRAEVRWFLNDKPVLKGIGEKRFETTAGRAGELTLIRISATAENGALYSGTVSFRPAEVNLLWQAQSYTPPFYRGKALMPFQGTVLVAAVPSFTRGQGALSAESLIYTWKEGDNVIGDSSGKGKSLFVFQGSVPLRTKTISVLVESPDRTMTAEATIDVEPVSPRLLFYENHPRHGLLFGKALDRGFLLSGDETSIDAIPYYFETKERNKNLVYEWQMNYKPLTSERDSSITVRRISNTMGRTNLFLEARSANEDKTFQAAEESILIEFPQKSIFNSAEIAE